MFIALLTLHNVFRWVVLFFSILAIARAFMGWLAKKEYTAADSRAGMYYVTFLDIQVLIGIVLYFFFSPLTRIALNNFSAAMGETLLRFYAIEHSLLPMLALVAAHTGRILAKKAEKPLLKHRRSAVWFLISILLILGAIPWPFLTGIGRPLLRLFGIQL